MTKKINQIQKSICATLLAIFIMFTGGLGLLFSKINLSSVYASMTPVATTITNNEFNSDSVSGSIVSPTGWTKVNSSSNVASGIISIDQTIFEKQMKDEYLLNFKPYSYEGINDNQILMINSKSTKSNAGYKSESFTLSKSSFYTVSFRALTENSNFTNEGGEVEKRYAFGSANLIGTDIEDLDESVISINTSGSWNKYIFYVETGTVSDLSVSLQLWLGFENGVQSYGAVFFDNIEIYKISEDSYRQVTNNANAKLSNICNLNTSVVADAIKNANFENVVSTANTKNTGWKVLTANNSSSENENNYSGLCYVDNRFSSTTSKVSTSPTNANLYGNTRALLINNQVASSIGFESSTLVIKQQKTYKISFYAKTNLTSGTAQAKIVENNPYEGTYEDFETKEFTLDIDTTTLTNTQNNDWIEYSIYVKGRNFEDTSLSLQLWLGTSSEAAVGYAFFDNVTVYEITTKSYVTGIKNEHILEANFASKTSTLTISNGAFNDVETSSVSDTYPYAVSDWTQNVTTSNSSLSGIINTKDTLLISTIANPTSGNIYSNNNNVLMIGNVGSNSQTYKNNTAFTLSSDAYYKLSFMVQTQNLTNGAKASVKLYSSTKTLKELMYIESDSEWTTYNLYIKIGSTSVSANIELGLGVKNSGCGYAFFDNVVLSSSDETTYSKTLSSNEYKVNLAQEDFTNTSDKSTNGIFVSNTYTTTNSSNTSNVKSGVIDVKDPTVFENYLVGYTNPNLPESGSGNVLMISSNDDCYYYYKSADTYTLSQDSYYKISVWVRTNNVNQLAENLVTTNSSGTEYYKYGALLTLTNIAKTFSGIVTDSWKQYTFYINATEDADVQIMLALGQENALTSGTVYFANVNVETIDETAYKEAVKPLETDSTIDNIMAVGSTETSDDNNNDNNNTDQGINFNWLILPTLITALALIIAVVGVIVRRFVKKHPMPVKIKSGPYDRQKSLEKDFEHREVIRRQQEKLEKLKQQLQDVQTEIIDSKVEFKKEQKEHEQKISEEIKVQKAKSKSDYIEKSKSTPKQDKQTFIELRKAKETDRQKINEYKLEQKKIFLEQKKAAYDLRQKELQEKYNAITLEIEAIYQEELSMIKAYKEYRKEVALKKKELREQKRQERKQKNTKKSSKKDSK